MGETPGMPSSPAPDARGDLAKTPFAHLLVYASERRLTGSIEFVQADGRTSAIALAAGEVTKARTSEPVAPLGKLLLEMGYVTQEVLDATRVTLTEKGGLHGEILREAGVSAAHIREALQAQLALKLDYIFTLPPDTTFAFFNAFDLLESYGAPERTTFDLLAVIWRGVCLAPPSEHVEAALKRVEGAKLRLKSTASVEQIAVTDEFVRVVTLMRARPSTLAELLGAGGATASTMRLVIYTLLITKHIEPVEAVTVAVPMPQLPTAAALALSAAQRRPMVGFAAPVVSVVTAENLGLPAPKSAASSPAAAPSPPAAPSPAAASTRSAAPIPTAASSPVATSGADLAARRIAILALAGRIERMNYFEMLDVPHDALPEAIEARFIELARTWHPDRLPATLADVKESCTRVFGRFTEAHKTLMHPENRSRYMTLVKDGGATPEAQAYIARIVDAATTFQRAEFCAKRGDFVQAGELCRRAHQQDPTQADYLALLAWIESMDPARQSVEVTREKIAMLDRAIAVSPRSERSYYYRGMLYKKAGQMDVAAADFRKAVELNSRNTEAVREVHLFESRKGAGEPSIKKPEPQPPSKITGLLSKLLGK